MHDLLDDGAELPIVEHTTRATPAPDPSRG
jgi:hypothetical protein